MDESLKDLRCARCGGATLPGQLRDSQGGRRTPEPQTWMPRMTGDGSLIGKMAAKDAARAQERTVVALRGMDCGRIALFAP